MAPIYHPPHNLVPRISVGALPSPASDWAEDMHDILGAHFTRTPAGTSEPAVPCGLPAPSAKEYIPVEANVKHALGYLPEGVATDFSDTKNSTFPSSIPQNDASRVIEIGHGGSGSVPYPPTREDTNPSTKVHTGHSSSLLSTSLSGYDTPARDDTNPSTKVHTGHSLSPISPSLSGHDILGRDDTDPSMKVHTGHSFSAISPSLSGHNAPSRDDTNPSMKVHTGHGSSLISPSLSGYDVPVRDDTNNSTKVHTGHSSSAMSSGHYTTRDNTDNSMMAHTGHSSPAIPPAAAFKLLSPLPSDAELVASPDPLSPGTSTEFALTAQDGSSFPPSTLESVSSMHLVSTAQPSFDSHSPSDSSYFQHAADLYPPSPSSFNNHSISAASPADSVHLAPPNYAHPTPGSSVLAHEGGLGTPSARSLDFTTHSGHSSMTESGYPASQESELRLGLPVPLGTAAGAFNAFSDPTVTELDTYRGTGSTHPYADRGEVASVGAGRTRLAVQVGQRDNMNGHRDRSPASSEEFELREGGEGKKCVKKPKLMQRLKKKMQVGGAAGDK
ncbi:hypothetical protein C8R43DRAFT_1111795 [Mycena crocata]|nr:hypothetical protein C8R43DRAFT_1111795 [Mycena crocata]